MERKVIRKLSDDWEDMAQMDMLFSILSEPGSRFGKWDHDEFFSTGQTEISGVMQCAAVLGRPVDTRLALDFGCGVGRLTRALATYFEHASGLDISKTMVDAAKEFNAGNSRCDFQLHSGNDLSLYSDGNFDMIYTRYVLQHIPKKSVMKHYIREMVRVLKADGLLVFQVPSIVPLKNRIQPRRRAYTLLKGLGFSHRFLYQKIGLDPIVSNYLTEGEATALIKECGAIALDIRKDSDVGPARFSRIYYVSKS